MADDHSQEQLNALPELSENINDYDDNEDAESVYDETELFDTYQAIDQESQSSDTHSTDFAVENLVNNGAGLTL